MQIAIPKEIKNHEYRVALTPAGARELSGRGHTVTVQAGAGEGAGFADDAYAAAGARTEPDAVAVWRGAELILKVKEPQPDEVALLEEGQTLFTYLHLAAEESLTRGLMKSGATCIAYETINDRQGGLPLLAPMSTVAGRMAIQAGTHCLEKAQGGAGVLLPGVPGVAPAKVAVIGGGVVGENAARMALGLGAEVTVLDKSIPRLETLDDRYQGRMKTVFSTADAIDEAVRESDLIVGAVLIPGAQADNPCHARRHEAGQRAGGCRYRPGRLLRDQPGNYARRAHLHGGWHRPLLRGQHARSGGADLDPGAYVIALADRGWRQALADDHHFAAGLNVHAGQVTHAAVADAFGLKSASLAALLT